MTKTRMNLIADVTEERQVEFRQEEVKQIDAGSVLIEIKASAICGGDIKLFTNNHPFVSLPAALGHEMSGVVVEAGTQVEGITVGDKVVVEPIVTCDKCPQCLKGDYHLCEQINFLYRLGAGGMARYITVPAKWAHLMPEELSFEEGALIEPLAVALHAWNKADIKLGESVCIIGCGPIGLLLIQLAHANGCSKIIGVDRQQYRLELAKEFGATAVVTANDGDTVAKVKNICNKGVNAAFEAVGSPVTLGQCLEVLSKKGRLTIVGLFQQPEVAVPVNIIVQKEITVKGSQAYCWDFQEAIQLVESGKVNLRKLVSHRLKLSQVQQALEISVSREEKPVKVICKSD